MILLICLVGFLITALVSWVFMLYDCIRVNILGPFPWPVLGNTLLFQGDSAHLLKTLQNMYDKYGGAVRVHLFLSRYFVIADTKYVEPLISSPKLIIKGRSYDVMKPWLGNGLLTASGAKWRLHRKFLTPAFHFNILQNFLPVFCRNEIILTKKLSSLANGEPFDLFPVIALSVLDNVTESIMGVSINAQKDSDSNYVKAIEDMAKIVSERMRNPFIWKDFCFNLVYGKRQDKALGVLRGVTTNVIKSRQEDLKKNNITCLPPDTELGIKNKHAFLDLLLLSEIDGQRIDDKDVREEVETFMFEGHDTTTSGVVFSLYCISKHKDVEDKILQEQKDIFGDNLRRSVAYGDLQRMQYLELVIKESMRLYPPVPFIERSITRDTKLADVTIPKNSLIIVNILVMQRNPDLYENPLEFQPERHNNTVKPYSWIPFSAGPRNCIGQKFAMMEMKVTLSNIIRNFKLVPSNKEPVLSADLILRSKNGVHVGFLPRD